jgi:hypothetical protein
MNPITATLELGGQGPQVANLQEALAALLERATIQPNDPDFRQELLTLVQDERSRTTYGDVTGKIVGLFQKELG